MQFPHLSPKTTTPRTTSATSERIQNILHLKQLDPMPALAARAFQLASDPQATASDFVEIIEGDEVLGSRVIRIANSVYFFRGSQATDIDKAVANIGLDELRCILTATMLRSLLKAKRPAREQIWANAVGTAICSRNLARFTPQISSGEAFLSGLVHDVGKLILIQRGGSEYDRVIQNVAAGDKSFIEAEEEVFSINHVEVGIWAGEQWNFPAAILEAIAAHHNPLPKKASKITNAALVQIADTLAHTSRIGHPPSFARFQKRSAQQLHQGIALLGMNADSLDRFTKEFIKQFDQEYRLYQMEHS